MLISTTLTGNDAALIGDALRSVVAVVDRCLVLDTGVTDGTLDVAREVAGEKLIVERHPWTRDFAGARNAALERAAAHGGRWALTLDTDERIVWNGVEPAPALNADPRVRVWLVASVDGSYAKERFIRLPTPLRWEGRTHEALCGAHHGESRTLPGVRFFELAKTPEQAAGKFERDLGILREAVVEQPANPRWHYYLGETLRNLGRPEEAIGPYVACAELRGWDEESAFACYRAAECASQIGDHARAVDLCALGLARHAGIPELAWLAAFSSYRLGRWHQAIAWAHLAIAGGEYRGHGALPPRIGFRHPPALYEGPYDVLRFAYPMVDRPDLAREAEADFQAALRAREAAAAAGA